MYYNPWSALVSVFSNKKYILLAIGIAILFFMVAMLVPGLSAVKFAWTYSPDSLWAKIKALVIVWKFFEANSTIWSRWLVLIVALLGGINFSLLIFYLRRRIRLEKSVGTGLVGMIIGLLGIGCASCGSVILSSIFGFTLATAFLGSLPFRGKEIGIFGILLLLLSIYLIAQKIQNPASCKIKT